MLRRIRAFGPSTWWEPIAEGVRKDRQCGSKAGEGDRSVDPIKALKLMVIDSTDDDRGDGPIGDGIDERGEIGRPGGGKWWGCSGGTTHQRCNGSLTARGRRGSHVKDGGWAGHS